MKPLSIGKTMLRGLFVVFLYQIFDGTYPANCRQAIDGVWHYFRVHQIYEVKF